MSIKTYVIQYDAIEKHLEEENIRAPNRTWNVFDLLLLNTNTALKSLINGDETAWRSIAVTLDDSKKLVTVFDTPIEFNKEKIVVFAWMKDKKPEEQLYYLFTETVNYARTEQYDKFFRVVEVSEEQRAIQV